MLPGPIPYPQPLLFPLFPGILSLTLLFSLCNPIGSAQNKAKTIENNNNQSEYKSPKNMANRKNIEKKIQTSPHIVRHLDHPFRSVSQSLKSFIATKSFSLFAIPWLQAVIIAPTTDRTEPLAYIGILISLDVIYSQMEV